MHLVWPPRHPVRSDWQHNTIEESQLLFEWSVAHALPEVAVESSQHAGKSAGQAWLDAAIIGQGVPNRLEGVAVFVSPLQ